MSDKPMAYLAEIATLEPIKDKDRIVLASFTNNNWKVIVQKDQHHVGQKVVYIETESILPVWPVFQFLEKRCYSVKRKGYVIKRMSMAGVDSEGIVFNVSALPEKIWVNKSDKQLEELDWTKALEIRRKDDEVPQVQAESRSWLQNKIRWLVWKLFKIKMQKLGVGPSDFPSYCMKTDETQAQSIPGLFDKMKGKDVITTLKIDGMSGTFAHHKGLFIVATRNRTIYKQKIEKAKKALSKYTADKWKDNPHLYVAAKYDLPRVLNTMVDVALQGEVAGPGIQKNRLGLKDYDLFIFNMYSITQKKFYALPRLKEVTDKHLLKLVPFLEVRKFDWSSIKEMEQYAAQYTYDNGSPAEGVVIRGFEEGAVYMEDPMQKMHGQLSLKIINPKFKMKYQDEEE